MCILSGVSNYNPQGAELQGDYTTAADQDPWDFSYVCIHVIIIWSTWKVFLIPPEVSHHSSAYSHKATVILTYLTMGAGGCSAVAKSCLTLCDLMNCSTPGFPVFHYLPEFAQTQVHWVTEVIQPSYPRLPSSLALNLPQHQGLFQWVALCIRWPRIWASASASIHD